MVEQGDCLKVMAGMEASSVDAIVTDPPYGLSFMGKEWDRGVPGVPFWAEALRVVRPGSYLLAMGGTRTWHRLAVAIEDAGWQMRDTLCWLYGQGFPKGKACLKPAWEPIVMARKPGKMRALRVDDCRLATGERQKIVGLNNARPERGALKQGSYSDGTTTVGRWPANVCLDEEAAAMLDEQSGERHGGWPASRAGIGFGSTAKGQSGLEARTEIGGASRFFYVAKASRGEREAGLHEMPRRGVFAQGDHERPKGPPGSVNERLATTPTSNPHPTVKPIALMRWLCRLVTPPGGTVLDPFAGSGTTGCAAALEGLRFVGIEKEAEYVAIANARIKHWGEQGVLPNG